MTKVFISQPMNGKTDAEILSAREMAIKSVKEKISGEVEIIDSFFQDAPRDKKPLWLIGKSLEFLSTADVAFFAKGWETARGCKIEKICAIEYGIDVIIDCEE